MSATLKSVVGRKDNKKPEETVDSKDDIINKDINKRLKRKQALHDAMNKLHDPDIA